MGLGKGRLFMWASKRLPVLLALLGCMLSVAHGESLISSEMIRQETVHYRDTATVSRGVFRQTWSDNASEYYPHTYVLRFGGESARFGDYLVGHKDEVKAGDVLATFDLQVDEVALAAKKLELQRACEALEIEKSRRQKDMQTQLEHLALLSEPFEVELQTLRIQRAQVEMEQYCAQQQRRIETLQRELEDMNALREQAVLIAPFDGVVAGMNFKRAGEKINHNDELITLYRTDSVLLRVDNTRGRFRYGMQVQLALGPVKARTLATGRVVASDELLPQSRRAGYAYIEVDPFQGPHPGYSIKPSVTAQTCYVEGVFTLPSRAVGIENGKYFIHKLAGDSVEKRFVNLAVKDVQTAWILQGVQDGDVVVID